MHQLDHINFTGYMLFLTPNQQYQSTEGKQAQRFMKIHILSQAVLAGGFMTTVPNVHAASPQLVLQPS